MMYCLTPSDLSDQIKSAGQPLVVRPPLNASGRFEISPVNEWSSVSVFVFESVARIIKTLFAVSRLFHSELEPKIEGMDFGDQGDYEVIIEGYRGDDEVTLAFSTRFETCPTLPADLQISGFYFAKRLSAGLNFKKATL